MSKVTIEFSPDLVGRNLSHFTWDWCKKLSNDAAVSVDNVTMTERGYGVYVLNHPDIATDTDFRLHLTEDEYQYATGIFSLSDGNLALQSTLTELTEDIVIPKSPGTIQVLGKINQSNREVTISPKGKKTITFPDGSQIITS
jgi:hypothetical protein